jgi:phosphatidylinositol glycan class N
MAALIGIDWPVNSVGVLPDVDPTRPGYLDTTRGEEAVARAAFVNAKVILDQYKVKHGAFNFNPLVFCVLNLLCITELKEKNILLYVPFAPLAEVSVTETAPQITAIETLLQERKWELARQACFDIIGESLKGLHYLQTYDRFLIKALVTAAYLGWAAYASLYTLRSSDPFPEAPPVRAHLTARIIKIVSWSILIGFWASFALQKRPWTFYVYIAFPSYFWQKFFLRVSVIARFRLGAGSAARLGSMVIRCLIVVFALLCMVVRFRAV